MMHTQEKFYEKLIEEKKEVTIFLIGVTISFRENCTFRHNLDTK